MSENLSLIHQREVLGKDFKVYGDFENPLFLAKDVAEWIEHSDSQKMLQSVDPDEKVPNIVRTPGGPQEAWFVTEDGLYEVLMQSRKPIAKAFKKQVKGILRTVRRHGVYMTPDTIEKTLTNPDFIIQLATQLKEEQQKRLQVEETLRLNAPKVNFAESVEISKDCILVRSLSSILKQNGIDIGQNRLFEKLRSADFLIKSGKDHNMPTQKSMELGLFKIETRTIATPSGEPRIKRTPYITGKGQVYFVNMFLKAA